MSKTAFACAFLLLLAALALPAEAAAAALAGGDAQRLAQLARGVVLLKGMLAANAVLLALAAWFAPREGSFEALAGGVRAQPRCAPGAKWLLGAVLVLALALRLNALSVGISFDEIDTLVHYARKPLVEVATTFDSQNQHLLFSLLARASCVVLGESVWAVRLPAVVLGVASIWAAYRFALLVAERREALAAAALLALSYHHVWFSQDARGYTGLLLFTLLGTHEFLRMLGEREPRGFARPLRYGLWMALATLTHATAALAVAAHGAVWLAALWTSRARACGPNRRAPALGFLFAVSLSLALYALVLPQFVRTLLEPTMPGAQTEWKDPLWLVRETLAGFSKGLPGGVFTLGAGSLVALIGARSYWKQGPAVLGTFLLGTALTAAALLATHHNLWPRMFFFSAGFYVLIALRGVSECVRVAAVRAAPAASERLTLCALGLVCAMSAVTLRSAWLPKQDFEGPRAYLAARAAPADAILTVDMTVMPYSEYFTEPWTPVDNADALARIESAHPRTWIVYTTPTRMKAAQPQIWRRIESEYRTARTFWGTLGGGEVVVAVRGADLPDDLEGPAR